MKPIAKWVAGITVTLFCFLAIAWWYLETSLTNKHLVEANAVAAQFHREYNAGEFGDICQQVFAYEGEYRKAWLGLVQETHKRAGKFQSVTSAKIRAYIEPSHVHANYVSSFEKGTVSEDFTLKDRDGHFVIVFYKISMNGEQIVPLDTK